jgi:hypothetical protein
VVEHGGLVEGRRALRGRALTGPPRLTPSRPLTGATAALRAAILAAVLAALLAPAADAASNLEISIADDAALLEEPDDERAAEVVQAWRDLGIDSVRIFAQWQIVSPRPTDRAAPAGFDAANPDDPRYDWRALDRAVRLVRASGMRVMLAVSGPGPLWATADPAAGNQRLRPRPDLFGRYARAVALRYGADVDRYIVWNEPNLPLWLQPQFTCSGRACTPYAPHLYRRLAREAWSAIHAADPVSQVLIGALAPRGQNPRARNAAMRPLTFLRALGCVGSRLQRVRSGPCAGLRPAQAEGIAYHPHGVLRAPDEPNPNEDEASLADLPRLKALLDAVQRTNGLRNTFGRGRPFDLHFTEYGYQTRPPDGRDGVRPSLQAKWLQQAAAIAWRDPRVRNLTQYEWRDEPVRGSRFAGWQSGLRLAGERAKPALRGFPQPFWVDQAPRSRVARLWGQVRPGGSHDVSVQRRTVGAGRWVTFRRLRTDGRGAFALRFTVTRRSDLRFAWRADAGAPLRTSDTRRVTPPVRRR